MGAGTDRGIEAGRGEALLDAAALAAERFLRGDPWRAGLDEVLERLGRALGASRAYLYRTTPGGAADPVVQARWSAPEAPPAPSDHSPGAGAEAASLAPWNRRVERGEALHGLTREQDPELQPILERWSVRSFAVVPVQVAGALWGVLGVSDCVRERRLTAAELSGLATAARVLGAALERERGEQALRASEERLRLLVQNVPAVVYLREAASGRVLFLSPGVAELTGRRAEDFLAGDADLGALRHPDDAASVAAQIDAALLERRPYRVVYRLREGFPARWVEERGQPVVGEDGRLRFLEGSLVDVTERHRFEEQLLHHTLHDPLTGLANRALLLDRLRVAIRRVRRPQSERFAVLLVDLDRFKVINDSLGHTVGDHLLQAIAHRLVACVRPGDTVARLGGDEFAVLLEELDEPADALRVAERIQSELHAAFAVDAHELYSAASIGLVMGDARYGDADELLRDADTALYQAKAEGRGRHVVFDPDMHRRALARLQLESELRRALEREELEVHFQPIVALDDGAVVGVEALLRWRHPEHGLLSPDSFLEVAAESGQLPGIGAWVLRQGCAQLRRWVSVAPDLVLHVNLHPVEFTQPALAEQVAATIRAAGLAPGRLQLELTEHLVMAEPEATVRLLERLREVGVGLCLDDFGTGHSSLAALHRFPISALKLDRSFVAGLGRGEEGAAVVRTVGALGRAMHLAAIAEGIEEPAQLATLRELGYRFGQGYHFARPMPADEMTELLGKTA